MRDESNQNLSWFQHLAGFAEADYPSTQACLAMDGHVLLAGGRRWQVGPFATPSLAELRQQVAQVQQTGPLRPPIRWADAVVGDVRAMHRDPAWNGAVFQVASQFNMLEMTRPEVTPEAGVTRYASDHTQGPACAIACGAATLYRNYLVPVANGGGMGGQGDPLGQTRDRQLDGAADLRAELAFRVGCAAKDLWQMRNGYLWPSRDGLTRVAEYLRGLAEPERDQLRQLLRVGWHADTQVTDRGAAPDQRVGQVFCSALPVGYVRGLATSLWEPLATLVLEACYEATLLCAVLRAEGQGAGLGAGLGGSAAKPTTLLYTHVGGGVFGNEERWILAAVERLRGLKVAGAVAVRRVRFG